MSTNTNVLKALSDPKVFSGFDELLHSLPAHQRYHHQQLDSSTTCTEASKALANTLRLFSYGTFRDYCSAEPGTYIHLNERQLQKLKALTVATTVHRNCSSTLCGIITYETLEAELGISSATMPTDDVHHDGDHRALEDLVIHCIYSNLLPSGTKLDQKNKHVIVKLSPPGGSLYPNNAANVLCRDVDLDQDLPEMINSLERFHVQGKLIREYLTQHKQSLTHITREENDHWKRIDLQLQSVQQRIRNQEWGSASMEAAGSFSSSMMEWAKSSSTGTAGSALPIRQVKRSRGGCDDV